MGKSVVTGSGVITRSVGGARHTQNLRVLIFFLKIASEDFVYILVVNCHFGEEKYPASSMSKKIVCTCEILCDYSTVVGG